MSQMIRTIELYRNEMEQFKTNQPCIMRVLYYCKACKNFQLPCLPESGIKLLIIFA